MGANGGATRPLSSFTAAPLLDDDEDEDDEDDEDDAIPLGLRRLYNKVNIHHHNQTVVYDLVFEYADQVTFVRRWPAMTSRK